MIVLGRLIGMLDKSSQISTITLISNKKILDFFSITALSLFSRQVSLNSNFINFVK